MGLHMGEAKETKITRKKLAIAFGIICIVLIVALVGVLAYSELIINNKSSPDQATDLSWTEGSFCFNLTSCEDVNFTIPTAGFRSVTITVDAWSSDNPNNPLPEFPVFIGFMTANTTVDYQVYDAQPYSQNLPMPFIPPGYMFPPWSYFAGYLHWPASLKQTYDVTFSEIMVWIWNKCNAFSPSAPIWGNVCYYLTT